MGTVTPERWNTRSTWREGTATARARFRAPAQPRGSFEVSHIV